MNKTLPLDRKTYLDREVVKALSKDLGLDAEAVARLHGVTKDDQDSIDDVGVLEEVRSNAARSSTGLT